MDKKKQPVGFSIDPENLASLDDFKAQRGFKSRSAALNGLLRYFFNLNSLDRYQIKPEN